MSLTRLLFSKNDVSRRFRIEIWMCWSWDEDLKVCGDGNYMRLLTIKLLNGLFCELKMCDSESNFFLSHSLSLPKDFHKKRKFDIIDSINQCGIIVFFKKDSQKDTAITTLSLFSWLHTVHSSSSALLQYSLSSYMSHHPSAAVWWSCDE